MSCSYVSCIHNAKCDFILKEYASHSVLLHWNLLCPIIFHLQLFLNSFLSFEEIMPWHDGVFDQHGATIRSLKVAPSTFVFMSNCSLIAQGKQKSWTPFYSTAIKTLFHSGQRKNYFVLVLQLPQITLWRKGAPWVPEQRAEQNSEWTPAVHSEMGLLDQKSHAAFKHKSLYVLLMFI